VTNFTTKKLAIINKLGFGWIPDYLIQDELKKNTVTHLRTDFENKVSVRPKLYYRPEETLGKAAKELLQFLAEK
jgi:DNA-binding transcriptional LysR family regulator